MGNFARKIIDAVQNSLLDKLVARLFPIAPVTLAALPRPETYEHLDVAASIVGLFILGGIAMWVIGFIANRRPRPRKIGPLDKLHETPPNGFAAWSEPPEGGLRPYRPMLALIRLLGPAAGNRVIGLATFVVVLLALSVILAATLPRQPLLEAWGSPWVQTRLVPALLGLVGLLTIHAWATEQRVRLNPALKLPPLTGVAAFVFDALLMSWWSVLLGLFASAMFGWPIWTCLVVASAVALICVLAPRRDRILEAIFGRKTADDLPDRGTP